jgi:hypothetical protein
MKQLPFNNENAPIGLLFRLSSWYFWSSIIWCICDHWVFIMEFVLFTLWYFFSYAFILGGTNGLKVFLDNNITPALTALGTCSSIALFQLILKQQKEMQIPAHIRNILFR